MHPSHETAEALYRMKEAYVELREKDSGHSLLKLIELNSSENVIGFKPEFYEKFRTTVPEPNFESYKRYISALKEAIED